MLVVIGILAALVAILIPVILGARGKANTFRIKSDLNAITIALEAYHQDFGDYPRIDCAFPWKASSPGTPATGAQVLAKALLGSGPKNDDDSDATLPRHQYNASTPYMPGDLVWVTGTPKTYYQSQTKNVGSTPSGNTTDWFQLPLPIQDGAEGYGFRIRAVGQSPVRGPYLNTDKFKVGTQMAILDALGNPVLYFPARAGRPPVARQDTSPKTTHVQIDPNKPNVSPAMTVKTYYVSFDGTGFYDVESNLWVFDTSSSSTVISGFSYPGVPGSDWPLDFSAPLNSQYRKLIQRIPADPSVTPSITFAKASDLRDYVQYQLQLANEYSGPYLLWSAGVNGSYFDTDDVTNFNK